TLSAISHPRLRSARTPPAGGREVTALVAGPSCRHDIDTQLARSRRRSLHRPVAHVARCFKRRSRDLRRTARNLRYTAPRMQIDVALLPGQRFDASRSVCVIVDVLRASSSIVTLLERGAACVVAAPGIEEARALYKR